MRVSVKLRLDGWRKATARTKAVVRAVGAHSITIGPTGKLNEAKAAASFARGDNTYPVPDAANELARTTIEAGVADMANDAGLGSAVIGAVKQLLQGVADGLVSAIQGAIEGGQVTGPPRSRRWIETKGHDTNMVGTTGAFVESLDSEVARKGGSRAGARRAAA